MTVSSMQAYVSQTFLIPEVRKAEFSFVRYSAQDIERRSKRMMDNLAALSFIDG